MITCRKQFRVDKVVGNPENSDPRGYYAPLSASKRQNRIPGHTVDGAPRRHPSGAIPPNATRQHPPPWPIPEATVAWVEQMSGFGRGKK